MNYSPPGSSVHGISQARILEWVPFPPQGVFPTWGWNLSLLHWQADSLPLSHLGSWCPIKSINFLQNNRFLIKLLTPYDLAIFLFSMPKVFPPSIWLTFPKLSSLNFNSTSFMVPIKAGFGSLAAPQYFRSFASSMKAMIRCVLFITVSSESRT